MKRVSNRQLLAYGLLGVGIMAYAYISLNAPVPPHTPTYGLRKWQLSALDLTFIIPLAAVWIMSFYGALQFRLYTSKIRGSKDGKQFSKISLGLVLLFFGIVVSSFMAAFRPFMLVNGHPQMWSILSGYINLIFPLLAFYYIYNGSQGLLGLATPGKLRFGDAALVLSALTLVYSWVVFTNPARNFSPNPSTIQSYFLPDVLIVLTLMAPYILMWYWGLQAGSNLLNYRDRVGGKIYKKSLSSLANGILAVIGFSILIQLITAASPLFTRWGLSALLALIYVIILLYGLGYLLIARGARRMAKIEEVL